MKIRKLLAVALVLVLALAAIPVFSLAEGARAVTKEAKQMSKMDKVWAAIDAAEASALSSSRATKQNVIQAVYKAAINTNNVDKASFSDFTKDGFFFTVDGMQCSYNYRFRNELKKGAAPIPASQQFVFINGNGAGPVAASSTRSPNSRDVLLVAPYYGHDSAFTDQYKKEAQSIAAATGGNYTLIQSTSATGPAIAQNITNKGVVIYDSHGIQTGSSSYLCLTTSSGITTTDYNNGWAVRSGDEAFIDGRYIQNHINGKLSNCLIWMAICEGMKAGGRGVTGNALLAAGAGAVYGYSQSVSFRGDYNYEATFWTQMKNGATVANAIKVMKNTHGNSDPYTNPTAYPIVMSATDAFPSNPDSVQNVTCNWTLLGGGSDNNDTAITSVNLSNVSLRVGETKNATLTVAPSTAKFTASWSTSNSSIATVDSNGTVRGIAAGTTTLAVTVRDSVTGISYNRSATITVSGNGGGGDDTGSTYQLVNSIENGGKYIIVASNSISGSTGYAVGNTTVSNNRYLKPVAIKVGSNSITVSGDAAAITWTASGSSSSGFTFTNVGNNKFMGLDSSQYLCPSSSGLAWKQTSEGALDNQIDTDGYFFLAYSSGKYTTSKNSGAVKFFKVMGGSNTPDPAPDPVPNSVSFELASSIVPGNKYIIVAEKSVSGTTGYAVGNTTISGTRYLTPVRVVVNSNGTLSMPSGTNINAISWYVGGSAYYGYTFRNIGNNKFMGLDSAQYLSTTSNSVAWAFSNGALDNKIDTDGYFFLAYSNGKYSTSKTENSIRLYKVVEG